MNTPAESWHTVARASVLEPYGKALVKVGPSGIAIFRQGEQLFALEDRCPHSGASLCVGRVEDGHLRCPAHGLRFRLTDGLLAGSDPGSEASSLGVRTFPARLMNGELQLQLESRSLEIPPRKAQKATPIMPTKICADDPGLNQ